MDGAFFLPLCQHANHCHAQLFWWQKLSTCVRYTVLALAHAWERDWKRLHKDRNQAPSARRPEDFALSFLVLTHVVLPASATARTTYAHSWHPTATHTGQKSQAAFSSFSRKQEKPFAPGTLEHVQPARARSFAWTSTKDSNNSGMMSRANPCGDCPYFEVKFVTRTLWKHNFVQRTLPNLILYPPHRESTIWFVTHYII